MRLLIWTILNISNYKSTYYFFDKKYNDNTKNYKYYFNITNL